MAVHVSHVKPDLSVFERNAANAHHDSALLALAQEWLVAMNLQVFEDASGLRYGLFNGWHDEASNTDLSTLFLFNPACCQVLTMPCFEPQLAQDLSKAFANNLAQLSSDYSAHALADLERVLVQAVSQCQNVIPRNLNLLKQSSAVSIEEGELVWHLSSQESGFVPANTDFPIVRPALNSFKGLRFYSHLKAQDTPNSIAIGKNVGRLAESTGFHISPRGDSIPEMVFDRECVSEITPLVNFFKSHGLHGGEQWLMATALVYGLDLSQSQIAIEIIGDARHAASFASAVAELINGHAGKIRSDEALTTSQINKD